MMLLSDDLPQVSRFWYLARDGDPVGLSLYERHYSAYRYRDGRVRKLFMGPGYKVVLVTRFGDALLGWRKFRDASGQTGVNCAVFRNEGSVLSSVLIRDAETVAQRKWPGQRMYTYVNPVAVRSKNPGCCFKKAGWTHCGITKGGLLIFEKGPEMAVQNP